MNWDSLLEKLRESQEFPGEYTFKFIVKSQHKEELQQIFLNERTLLRPSKKGTYYSMTVKKLVSSPEEVKTTYERTQGIEGVMCL